MSFVRRAVLSAAAVGSMVSALQARERCTEDRASVIAGYRNTVHGLVAGRIGASHYRSHRTNRVVLTMSVDRHGSIVSSRVVRPSGTPVFDAWMLEAIPVGLRIAPIPSCTGLDRIDFTFPVRYP